MAMRNPVGRLWLIVGVVAAGSLLARADDEPKPDAKALDAYARSGEELAEPLVPLHPRTEKDRERLETLKRFVRARALEDRGRRSEALALLEDALKQSPDDVAILRRLSRLYLAGGRRARGLEYARKVLELEPDDADTLDRLMQDFERRNDMNGAEALLRKTVESPKINKSGGSYLLAQRNLGLIYADKLNQPEKAADALALVLAGLDEKAANNLSPVDQKRILGEEAETYAKFGEIFFNAKRYDSAITAFRRGLAYDPDDAQLPRFLALTYLRSGKPEAALGVLEPFLKRQPTGREPYELLTEILTALKRKDEILPRLEEAAKVDPKNAALQYYLADRYRDMGEPAKAEALYKRLLATQPDPQGLGALTETLLKEKKYEDLIKILGEAFAKPDSLEAVKPRIESIVNTPEIANAVLDEGIKLQSAEPPKLSRESRLILTYIANKAKLSTKQLQLQRMVLKKNPSSQAYQELFEDLFKAGQYEEATATLQEMLQKYPDDRTSAVLRALAQARMMTGKFTEAIDAAKEAIKLDPNDNLAQLLVGAILARSGKNEEAIAHYKEMLERIAPTNDEMIKRVRSGLSIAYVNLERFDEGEKELEILYEADPEDAGVNNDLGYLYADRGKNLDKAEGMVRKAVEEEPENASYLDSLGWVLFKQGKLKDALVPLEKAAKDPSADATIHDHLGDVYFKLKDLGKAKASWKAAQVIAEKGPPDKKLAEIKKKLETVAGLEAASPATPDPRP